MTLTKNDKKWLGEEFTTKGDLAIELSKYAKEKTVISLEKKIDKNHQEVMTSLDGIAKDFKNYKTEKPITDNKIKTLESFHENNLNKLRTAQI